MITIIIITVYRISSTETYKEMGIRPLYRPMEMNIPKITTSTESLGLSLSDRNKRNFLPVPIKEKSVNKSMH
jgi:hypothetical protein